MRGFRDILAMWPDPKMKETIRALWREYPARKFNCEWHPDGIIFSRAVVDEKEIVSYTGGKLFIHNWNSIREMIITIVPVLPPVDTDDPTVGIPVFDLGETSERIQRHKKVTYTATAVNTTLLTYTLDADSLLAGNTINERNGEVNYDEDWVGDAIITVTADGDPEATTATHTATTTVAIEGEDIISLADVLDPDTTPIHRELTVYGDDVELEDDSIYYLHCKVPVDEANEEATVLISKQYYREKIYSGHILILMGILNGGDTGRSFNMDWSNAGTVSRSVRPGKPPVVVSTRWIIVSETCLLDENSDRTGQQSVVRKKQKLTGIVWEDMNEETTDIITNMAACPPPVPPAPDPYRASISIGTTAYNMATDTNIGYSAGADVDVVTPIYPGSNRLFISIPNAKTLVKVTNAMGVNITSKYSLTAETDNRTGFQPNKVYRGSNVFFTDDYAIAFTIKIS